jgi:hypothetical protein
MSDEPEPMSDEPEPISDEPDLTELEDRLTAQRPVPSAAFRSALHQLLVALEARGPLYTRPRGLWATITVLGASGTAILAIVGAGLAGSGPFAP